MPLALDMSSPLRSFRMSASERSRFEMLGNVSSLMSGTTTMLSRLSALMCRQKGLVLLFSKEALRMLLMCSFSLSARCLLPADLILR